MPSIFTNHDHHGFLTPGEQARIDSMVLASMDDIRGSDRFYWLGQRALDEYIDYVADQIVCDEQPLSWADRMEQLAERAASR